MNSNFICKRMVNCRYICVFIYLNKLQFINIDNKIFYINTYQYSRNFNLAGTRGKQSNFLATYPS